MIEFALVFGAGLLAGMMNALAGAGSFVTIPAMILVGVPAVQANASSTVALLPGSLTSAWIYRDGLGPIGAVPIRLLLFVTLIGGMLGGFLLISTSTFIFDAILPWLLLLALLVLIFGRHLGLRLRRHGHIGPTAILVAQFFLGAYGGYFGGGVGLMMMASWTLLDNRDIKSLNAPRTFLVSAANAMAVLTFVFAGAVYWPETLVMLFASIIGGYLGAHLGRRARPEVVRTGTIVLTAFITLAFFIRAYGPGTFKFG